MGYISKMLVMHFHTMPIKGRMYVNSYCELLDKRFQLILLYSFCPNFGQIVGCSCLPCTIEFLYHVDEPVYNSISYILVSPIFNFLYHFTCKNIVVKWTILLNPQYTSKMLVTHFHTIPMKGRLYVNPYCELLEKRFQLILLYSLCPNFGQIVGCSCLPCMIEFLYHVDEPVYISLVECPSDVAFSSSVLRMWHLTYGHTHRPDLYM